MKFVAFERTLQGTGASRRLRLTNKVPGIVYGAGTPAMITRIQWGADETLAKPTSRNTTLKAMLFDDKLQLPLGHLMQGRDPAQTCPGAEGQDIQPSRGLVLGDRAGPGGF